MSRKSPHAPSTNEDRPTLQNSNPDNRLLDFSPDLEVSDSHTYEKNAKSQYYELDRSRFLVDSQVLRVARTKCDRRYKEFPARADWIKVVLSISGKKSLKVRLDNEPAYAGVVERWSSIVIPADVTEYVSSSSSHAISMFVNATKIQQSISGASDSDLNTVAGPIFNVVDPVIKELATEVIIDPGALLNNSVYADSLAFSVFSRVLRMATPTPVVVNSSLRRPRDIPHQLQRVVDYIHAEFHTDIRLDSLVEVSQLSHYSLSRLFQSYYNTSPHKYLVKVRMQKACEMLLNTNKPIDEIRKETGHNSLQWFSTAFKKEFGVSPMNFRSLSN